MVSYLYTVNVISITEFPSTKCWVSIDLWSWTMCYYENVDMYWSFIFLLIHMYRFITSYLLLDMLCY